jgi:hypothetical protein
LRHLLYVLFDLGCESRCQPVPHGFDGEKARQKSQHDVAVAGGSGTANLKKIDDRVESNAIWMIIQ